MALAIVLLILTLLKVNLVWTTVVPSNITEIMSFDEISEIFGTDEVPDYQVLSIILPEARRRFQDNTTIYSDFEKDKGVVHLLFIPTDGYLASRYTPVWLAVTDKRAHNKIRYDPLPYAMTDIGEFRMYHDVDNEAAIVVYDDPDHGAIIEGIVSPDYVIKSLPKRLIDEVLIVDDNHFIEPSLRRKKSIEPDADEIHCVLFKSPHSAQNAKPAVYRHKKRRELVPKRRNRSIPEDVYPEILLVLDHNAIRNNSITQALKYMLAFWNGVDMVYSTLDNPRVRLNIAGIIISADDAATPYIARNTSIKIKTHANLMLSDIAQYFAKELDRFPLRQYDIIFAMTPIRLCGQEANPCDSLLGISYLNAACTTEEVAKKSGEITSVGVIHYNLIFGGVVAAIHESAHLFGVDHDKDEGAMLRCYTTRGYIMGSSPNFVYQLKWSPRSQISLRNFFSYKKSECLDNKPTWIKPVHEVLPGRWLTLNGQCRNEGFEKWCQISSFPVCMIKGCTAENSSICKMSEYVPLEGTKCGENKYCEFMMRCVDE